MVRLKLFSKCELSTGLNFKSNVLYKSIASKTHSVRYELYFKNFLSAKDSSDCNEWARGKREQSRENTYYEWFYFIHVTCNMNAKGQTWNENIWTVTRPKEKIPNQQLSEVGPWMVEQTYKPSKLAFSDINLNRKLGRSPRSPYAGVATGLLKPPWTQLKK